MSAVHLFRLHSLNFKTADSQPVLMRPTVLTLGSFDGLHLGHQRILEHTATLAQVKKCEACLLSFYPHPSVALGRVRKLPYITNLHQRMEILNEFGIRNLGLIFFSEKIKSMGWEEFLEGLIHSFPSITSLVVGDDARIGKNAVGTAQHLRGFLEARNIPVEIVSLKTLADKKIGSRSVREMISTASFAEAAVNLGRPFSVEGKVVKGQMLGRTIDFPTANILFKNYCLPPHGVYAVRVTIWGRHYLGAANLGIRPTINRAADGASALAETLEVHLLDFNTDIYGQKISVEFLEKIREEQKFQSIDALKSQIMRDVQSVRAIYGE